MLHVRPEVTTENAEDVAEMTVAAGIKPLVELVVGLLVDCDYDGLFQMTRGVRLSANEIRAAVEDYGLTLVMPPEHAYTELDLVEVEDASPPEYCVWCALWTAEEGRSDLQLRLRIRDPDGAALVTLDDIRVP